MSLNKCSCNVYYTDSKEVQKEIGTCIEKDKPVMVVGECPVCGEKRVIGGEPDIDFETGESCVLLFGESYRFAKDRDLPVFQNVILEECDKEESEFSTFSRSKNEVIYLKIP